MNYVSALIILFTAAVCFRINMGTRTSLRQTQYVQKEIERRIDNCKKYHIRIPREVSLSTLIDVMTVSTDDSEDGVQLMKCPSCRVWLSNDDVLFGADATGSYTKCDNCRVKVKRIVSDAPPPLVDAED